MGERMFYMHGCASPDLETFTKQLISILTDSAPSLQWRTEETQHWYMSFEKNLGKERITRHINGRMSGHTMALLENDFEYNAIMPFGGYEEHSGGGLKHYCLFSKDDSLLVPDTIDKVVSVNFAGMPALIFMHDETHTSIKDIRHAHIVVDLGREKAILQQRYFDVENFTQ